MSVSYFVRYEGTAANHAGFVRYYREQHAPILARLPGQVYHQAVVSEQLR